MSTGRPSTRVTRLREKQHTARDGLDDLLDSTPLRASVQAMIGPSRHAAPPLG